MNPADYLIDEDRLAALASYEALDTPPDFEQDILTEIASQICATPVALISLLDDHRQWFKSNCGLPDMTECPVEISVCSATICANDILYVPDMTKDDRFKDSPLVHNPPYLKAYCGVPLINSEGFALGTLCVVDFEPFDLNAAQLESLRKLARQSMALLELRRQIIKRDKILDDLKSSQQTAEENLNRSEELLKGIFPKAIAEELHTQGKVEPRYHEMVSILFADFEDFTLLTEGMEPASLIDQLNKNFSKFDQITADNNVVTLRTVGDGYLCASGIPDKTPLHAINACLAALQLNEFVQAENRQRELLRLKPWNIRVGIHSGPAIAGVIGTKRLTYDIWGSAVNAAARLEQNCESNRINISATTLHHCKDLFDVTPRGRIDVKNLGNIDMYFLDRIKQEYSANPLGTRPNELFWKTVK